MPIGCNSCITRTGSPTRVLRGQPALLHRGRRQRREPDHVTDGVDVVDLVR